MTDTTLVLPADSKEQALLRGVVRDVLNRESGASDVRRHAESVTGFDPALWSLAGDLGWFGVEAPAAMGGTGQSFAEAAVVLEELGRSVAPGPYLSHLVATGSLLAAGGAAADTWGPRLVTGEVVACVVPVAPGAEPTVRAERRGDGLLLEGDVEHALDVQHAQLVLLPVVLDGDLAVLLLEPHDDGVGVIDRNVVDRTRRVGALRSDGAVVPPALLLAGSAARRWLDDVWARGATAVALDALGAAEAILQATVAYTSEREQFGRAIATFQAVKHGCANMLVAVETTRAAVRSAVRALGGEAPMLHVARAKAHAGDAASFVAGRGLQFHGGIGFTWEFDLHLWIKRAKLDGVLFGTSADHRAAAARLLFRSTRLDGGQDHRRS